MHHKNAADGCDMDATHMGSLLQSCPTHEFQYTASLVFVCTAPVVLFTELTAGPAAMFAPGKSMSFAAFVDPPPPRLTA